MSTTAPANRPSESLPSGGRGGAVRQPAWARLLSLAGGALLFAVLLALPAPVALSPEGWRTAAVAALMAAWWITEALPLPATALLPLVLLPALGVLEMPDAAAPYANEIIFLFMGGFFIAAALERWEAHRRIALGIIAMVGTGPRQLVLGFMAASAFLSMWISNTATAAMMFPIALAVGRMFRPPGARTYNFGIALMLGIAYASSIGGVATLIGTPPNAVLAGAASELLQIRIGFLEWMMVGLPLVIVLIPLAWLLLVGVIYPPGALAGGGDTLLAEERARLGRPSRGEKIVGAIFLLTAIAWVMRAPKSLGDVTIPGIQSIAPGVQDSTIAIGAALLLFSWPVDWRKGEFALDWQHASRIPWGILVLFGGGLSLARAMSDSGLAAWIGSGVATLDWLPLAVLVMVAGALFVFLTELTSNTATSSMAMPVMAGAAAALGIDPLILMSTAALATSMAFMLPVATPPNAIVFASDYVRISDMARAGIWMNLLAIGLLTVVATYAVPWILGAGR